VEVKVPGTDLRRSVSTKSPLHRPGRLKRLLASSTYRHEDNVPAGFSVPAVLEECDFVVGPGVFQNGEYTELSIIVEEGELGMAIGLRLARLAPTAPNKGNNRSQPFSQIQFCDKFMYACV
jgi:hypothetical protein